ncbi:MAG: hypothetical protein HQ553_14460 [Chloroflexi bacterium]|nr:hypothetical protein [Chloroflexota bacterium]
MKCTNELRKAFDEISNDPKLTRDQWDEAIQSKVREFIEKYREYHSQDSTRGK